MTAPLALPRVGVIAVTFRGSDVVLVKRKNEPQRHAWGYPGGSVHAGESLHDAALRELFEETGVQAGVEALLDVVEVREFDAAGRHHHFVLIAFLCKYVSGALCPGDDALDARWVSVPEGILTFPERLVDHAADVALKAREINERNKRQAGQDAPHT
jgi:8-oxo-dGTP diphosphatase